jgi:hypothetical protein
VREGGSGNFEGGDGWGEGPDSPEGRFGPWISLDAPRRPGPDVSAECPRLPGRGVRGRSEDSGPVLGPASAWRRRGRGTVAAGPKAAARQRPPLGGLGPVLGQEPSTGGGWARRVAPLMDGLRVGVSDQEIACQMESDRRPPINEAMFHR